MLGILLYWVDLTARTPSGRWRAESPAPQPHPLGQQRHPVPSQLTEAELSIPLWRVTSVGFQICPGQVSPERGRRVREGCRQWQRSRGADGAELWDLSTLTTSLLKQLPGRGGRWAGALCPSQEALLGGGGLAPVLTPLPMRAAEDACCSEAHGVLGETEGGLGMRAGG